MSVRPVDKPDSDPMRVSLSRVRVCPTEVSDVFWSDGRESDTDERDLTWTSRLRPRASHRQDMSLDEDAQS